MTGNADLTSGQRTSGIVIHWAFLYDMLIWLVLHGGNARFERQRWPSNTP